GDRGVDELRLLLRVVVGRAPDELHALGLRGRLRALLHHGPERALVAVGDHGEREARALGELDVRLARGLRPRVAALVGARATARHYEGEQEAEQAGTAGQPSHRVTTSSSGARI